MTDIVEDAELLALGQQLEQIEQRWIDRRIKDIRHQDDDPELEIWANISDQLFLSLNVFCSERRAHG